MNTRDSANSLAVSHWPARLIGVIGVIVGMLFSALVIAIGARCEAVFFLLFTAASLLMALVSGRTSMDQWGIRLSSPLGIYALDWDEMIGVVIDSGGNSVVFKGEGKQLVLPGFAFWAGRDKAEMRRLIDDELKRRGIQISRGFATFAVSRHSRIKRRSGPEKATTAELGDIESDLARTVALQPYHDRLTRLIDGGLRESAPDDPKWGLARRWTLMVLRAGRHGSYFLIFGRLWAKSARAA